MASTNINSGKLQVKILAISREAGYRAAQRITLRARASIIGQGRYDTGEMMSGFIIRDVTRAPARPTWRISNTSPHFPYQELGTPRDNPGIGFIYPRNGTFLVFTPRGASGPVFARKVRGVRPGNFLRNAVKATLVKDFLPGGALASV
jgi:hypothetical protein